MPFSARLGFQYYQSAVPAASFIPDYAATPTEAQYLHTLDSMSATAATEITSNQTPAVALTGYTLCAAPDGNIYMPLRLTSLGSNFQKINTLNNVVSNMSTTASNDQFQGSTLGNNGNIFLAPRGSNNVGEFDPSADTITTHTVTGGPSGSPRYYGALTLPDGDILCLPQDNLKMLRYTPGGTTAVQVGTASGSTNGFGGFTLAPNGSVYVIPEGASNVYKYDPVANTMTSIASGISSKYKQATTDNTGNVIAASHNATNFLHIDTSTDTVSTIAPSDYGITFNTSGGTPYTFGAHTIPNGNVMILAYKPSTYYEWNGKANTMSTHTSTISGNPTMLAGAYGQNDLFYCGNGSRNRLDIFRCNANTTLVSSNVQFTYALQPVGTGAV